MSLQLIVEFLNVGDCFHYLINLYLSSEAGFFGSCTNTKHLVLAPKTATRVKTELINLNNLFLCFILFTYLSKIKSANVVKMQLVIRKNPKDRLSLIINVDKIVRLANNKDLATFLCFNVYARVVIAAMEYANTFEKSFITVIKCIAAKKAILEMIKQLVNFEA